MAYGTAIASRKKLVLYDARYEQAPDIKTLGYQLNDNLRRAEKLIQGHLVSATCPQTVTLPANCRVGMLVTANVSGTPSIADASLNRFATDVICEILSPTSGVISPAAIVRLPLANVAGQGWIALYLGNNGQATPIQPATGLVQQVGNVRFFDQQTNLYEVYFFSGTTAFNS